MSTGNPERAVGALSVRTPAGVQLRPLSRADFDVALAMIRELYLLPEGDRDAQRRRYDAHINSVDSASLLALGEEGPLGIVTFQFRRRLNWATYEGWVSDLYVRTAGRRRGIGRALLQGCIEEWRLRRGHRLTLETSHDNHPARALYESLGMNDRGRLYQMRPPEWRGGEVATGAGIRPIEEGDFEAVARLLAELGRPAPTDQTLAALRRTYIEHLRRPNTRSLLAVLDGVPAGFLSFELREPFAMPAVQAWIPDLIVTEHARGRGIGAALMNAAVSEARANQAYALVLESGHQRAAAHRLYERAGMQDVGSYYVLDRAGQ